jgi:anti-sigma B factor antagonist/stage II sporulation protein AA (anti-sigma F factor antagonist)
MMNLPTREQSGVLVVTVSGRIDHVISEEFAQSLSPLLDQVKNQCASLVLDFKDVEYVSSAGLRVLMLISRQAKAQEIDFSLAALRPLVHEIFTISRFNLIIPCYATVDAAVTALGQ